LARDRSEQRPDRFAIGEKVDARVTMIDRKTRGVSLSIKAREAAEEKEAMATYGSADSGASLGDILGAAMDKANVAAPEEKKPAAKKAPAKKAAAKKADDAEKKPASKKADDAKKAPAKKKEEEAATEEK